MSQDPRPEDEAHAINEIAARWFEKFSRGNASRIRAVSEAENRTNDIIMKDICNNRFSSDWARCLT